jgi:hypothetical protein
MANIFVPKWARVIHTSREKNVLLVTGKDHCPFGNDTTIVWPGCRDSRSMHIEFANSETDSELLDFVAKYGPVNGDFHTGVLYPVKISSQRFKTVTIEQALGRLRSAQEAIAAAARAVSLLQLKIVIPYEAMRPLSLRIATSLGAEDSGRDSTNAVEFIQSVASKKTMELFAKREMSLTRDLLCEFLNRVPPRLTRFGNRIVELPHYDQGGVLPIIYYLLRQDLLSEERTIGICERCRRLFVVKRRGMAFCSPECSQLKRSLDYYHSKQSKGRSDK